MTWQPNPLQHSTESLEPLKRQSFESEVSDSAISCFEVEQTPYPAQQQIGYVQEHHYQQQQIGHVQEQHYQQPFQEQPYQQPYQQGHVYQGPASEVSYQSSGYDRNLHPKAVAYQNAPASECRLASEKSKSNLNRFSSISGKSINSERFCCGIFKSKKKCFWVCVPLWVFIVIALALTGFFVWPRIPGFKIGAPQNVNTKEFGSIEDLRNSSPDSPFKARFNLRVDVTVQSENYIPWTFNEIKIDGTLINPETGKPNLEKIGNGTRKNIVLQPRNTTTFGFVICF